MKKKHLAYIFAALTGIVVALIVTWPRVTANELYQRLAEREDLLVDFVKGYPVNDSVDVDVVIIAPADTADWIELLKELNFHEKSIELLLEAEKKGQVVVNMYSCEKNHPETRKTGNDNTDCVFVSNSDRKIYVFDIKSTEDKKAVLNRKICDDFRK